MEDILALLFYIVIVLICIELFLILIGGSLAVGAVGGLFFGIYRGFRNYFSALSENMKLRK